ncbi:hypothetical protein MVEN_00482400 [Mycena venus]|uniref:Uncharacterized protein n=1 Tax=Mycena venus TaxID=2733690 RepID=A0A8H6YVN1_9AGAR|nr:hypothetical protein MVEN_00482400 [Mycena venus]
MGGRYCVDLLPSLNVFAANSSSNDPVNAGLVANIRVTYDDFTTDTIIADSSWRAHLWVPGFEQLSFDDISWPTAIVKSAYSGTVVLPSNPRALNLDAGPQWFWTDDIPANGIISAGSQAFRRTFTPFPGQVPMSANIIIAVDDSYTLWVNNVQVGTDAGFGVGQQYTVNFVSPPDTVVFAVLGKNAAPGGAGVLFAAEINMKPAGRANCTAGVFVVGNTAWVSTTGTIPAGWQAPTFDDSAWPPVTTEATYPDPNAWGTISLDAPSPPVDV